MDNHNIVLYLEKSQEDSIDVCFLCEGQHGNNSLCQFKGGESYVI